MPVGFIQLVSNFGPSFFSTQNILKTLTSGETAKYRFAAFQDLHDYVRKATKHSTDTFYITGHSLGGGIATVIGTDFDIQAVTFSAPGLKATSHILRRAPRYGRLVRKAVNVVPDRDVVPMVDEQAGTVLKTVCPFSKGNPSACHRLTVTLCELLASCGDGGGRGVQRGYVRKCDVCRDAGQDDLPPQCSPPAARRGGLGAR
mmetsp:Transcript_71072/g.184547  ORF Transcript_71072/g.184547 Transcript_71072/m.184547 type:complete len:202 (+) Transcript_71072:1308-1913(+)